MSRRYDVFVSYADRDRPWVEAVLLDALQRAGLRCHSEAAFALGAPLLAECERALCPAPILGDLSGDRTARLSDGPVGLFCRGRGHGS